MKLKWSQILKTIAIIIYIVLTSNMMLNLEQNSIENTNEIERLNIEFKKCKEIKFPEIKEKKWQYFEITAYNANDISQGTTYITATGFDLSKYNISQLPIIAVDPEVIPLYSIVEIDNMGYFMALDTGEAIKGNRIDILFNCKEQALEFGRQELAVRILSYRDLDKELKEKEERLKRFLNPDMSGEAYIRWRNRYKYNFDKAVKESYQDPQYPHFRARYIYKDFYQLRKEEGYKPSTYQDWKDNIISWQQTAIDYFKEKARVDILNKRLGVKNEYMEQGGF